MSRREFNATPSGFTLGGRAVLVLFGLLMTACSRGEIETEYGKRGDKSVNGTAALSEMFRQAGFRVSTWKRFSPRLEQAEVLVWFATEFEPPSPAQRAFVEKWLASGLNRRLIYVGRDFDGQIAYWNKIENLVPPDQWAETLRRRGRAKSQFEEDRQSTAAQTTRWFVVRPQGPRYRPAKLAGPWAEGIDPSQLEIELQTRLTPPDPSDPQAKPASPAPTVTSLPPTINRGQQKKGRPLPRQLTESIVEVPENTSELKYTPLLTTERGDVMAMAVTEATTAYPHQPWNDGQVIVVANGSFLVNIGLANRENRKLAAKLIDACGAPRRVVFLESGTGGLPVFSEELDDQPNGFDLFRVWPLNFILGHLIILGILFCLAKFPIFGRPRQLALGSVSDFGKHITAVGELLEKTRNVKYARQLIANYHAVKTKEAR